MTSVGKYTEEQAKMLKSIFDSIDAEFERLKEQTDELENKFTAHDYNQRVYMEEFTQRVMVRWSDYPQKSCLKSG